MVGIASRKPKGNHLRREWSIKLNAAESSSNRRMENRQLHLEK